MKKPTDLDTLKAWCHWKKLEKGVSEDDLLMVKSIEDVISQAGTWKAKFEKLEKWVLDVNCGCIRGLDQEFYE